MQKARLTDCVPKVHVLLQKNRTQIENMVGADEDLLNEQKIKDEYRKQQENKKKK